MQFESRGDPIQTDVQREQSAPELNWPQSRDPISYRGSPKRQLSTPRSSGCFVLTYIFRSHPELWLI